MDTNFENLAKKELIDNILKMMVTPNLKTQTYSDKDESSYKDFIKSVKLNHKATVQLPIDFAIRHEMFELIKSGKVFIKSSIRFNSVFTTEMPTAGVTSKFESTYIGHEFYYSFLDNHPGIINIDKLKDIPIDYEGLMAVPLTILEFKNFIRFNVYRVLYTPKHNGKLIYPRVVISNKVAIAN